MDAQGLAKIWLFPTLGMLYEEALKDDPGAVVLLFRAFNRWLAEDWGMAYADRIFAAPYITLADVDEAVRELEWALDQDARSVVMRAAAPTTAGGPRSPAADEFDPFWARVNEAGITVVVHAGDAGLSSNGYAVDGFSASFRRRRRRGRASSCSPSSGRRTTSWPRSSSRSSSTASPTCASPRSRTVRSSWPPCSASCAPRRGACRATSARTPSSPSAATCGSTRSGRTTSTRSSTSWVTTG